LNALLKPSIAYSTERVADVRAEIEPLLAKHWQEIAFYPDIALNPRWEAYLSAEQAGALRVYTVRDRGSLIGYAVFFVNLNIHYGDSLQAAQDLIYVDPMYRHGRIGLGLIRFSEKALREEGVQLVMHHSKADPKHVFGALLERLGYERVDVIHCKRLDL
jgi:GNAT superfamily N-acetyltransferase